MTLTKFRTNVSLFCLDTNLSSFPFTYTLFPDPFLETVLVVVAFGRTYYGKQILEPVPKTEGLPKKLVYKFGPRANGWRLHRH